MSAVAQDERGMDALPQACTPCMARLDARPWHNTLAVRTGGFVSGVRVNTTTAEAAIAELLATLREPGMDREVAPNFSVELNRNSASRSRALHLVYRDHEIVSRRREVDALMDDLLELLDEPARLANRDRLAVHATGVVTARGGVVLIPGGHHRGLLTRRAQLGRAGLELLRSRTQSVDGVTGQVVLDLHDATLARLRERREAGRQLGRFPLEAWCVPGRGDRAAQVPRPEGVYTAYGMILNRAVIGNGPALQALSGASSTTTFWGVPALSPPVLASWLCATFGSHGDVPA